MKEPLISFGTIRYTYTKEKVEEVVQCLKDNNFKISSCFYILRLDSRVQNSIAEEIEFVEDLVPLARYFPTNKVWDAISLKHKGRGDILTTEHVNL